MKQEVYIEVHFCPIRISSTQFIFQVPKDSEEQLNWTTSTVTNTTANTNANTTTNTDVNPDNQSSAQVMPHERALYTPKPLV